MSVPAASTDYPVLPELSAYRRELMSAGAVLPLPFVPQTAAGLFSTLPPPPSGKQGWPWNVQTSPFATSTDDWPLITIVMPSFNQGAFLEEAMRSVLLQNYPRLEFMVMDAGSRDASHEIIERYRPWLSFARSAPDRGQAHALNLGFSLASADGLRGWLNSDDLYLPGAFRRLAECWRKNTGHDFFYGDALTLGQASGRLSPTAAGLAHARYVRFSGAVFSHAAFWTANAHVPVWEEQHYALDYELWIRLLPRRRTCHIAWPIGVFREHAAAKSSTAALTQGWTEDAERNARAHPDLYRPNRLLELEHRIMTRITAHRRQSCVHAAFPQVCRECHWPQPGEESQNA